MSALEIIAGRWPVSTSSGTSITLATGDSLQVRNAALDQMPLLVQSWVHSNIDFEYRIRSPNFHDNVVGLDLRGEAGQVDTLLPAYPWQRLVPQDNLTVTNVTSTGASDTAGAAFLIYYPELPGISARFASPDEVRERTVDIHPVVATISATASADWTGSQTLVADQDLLRANTDYAILGYLVDTPCTAIGFRGVDFGNLRLGGPGNHVDKDMMRDWFTRLSDMLGVPLIPVFNSANKNGIFIDAHKVDAAATVTVTVLLARFRTS